MKDIIELHYGNHCKVKVLYTIHVNSQLIKLVETSLDQYRWRKIVYQLVCEACYTGYWLQWWIIHNICRVIYVYWVVVIGALCTHG